MSRTDGGERGSLTAAAMRSGAANKLGRSLHSRASQHVGCVRLEQPPLSVIQLRTFPGLWVGRRQVLQASVVERSDGSSAYQCGSCDALIQPEESVSDLRDVVVKCACGEFNQH